MCERVLSNDTKDVAGTVELNEIDTCIVLKTVDYTITLNTNP